MKLMIIIIIFIAIAALWLVAHILFKPVYDRVTQQYVINNNDFKIANICIAIMLALALTIGLLI